MQPFHCLYLELGKASTTLSARLWDQESALPRAVFTLVCCRVTSFLNVGGLMPLSRSTPENARAGREWFSTTHWSTILAAGDCHSVQSAEALEKLCRTYWYPLYAYVRRRGFESHEAEDLTQEFFARFLAGDYVAKAVPAKGKFRFYLLGALNHFLSDAWDHARRLKRAGSWQTISIDVQSGDGRFQLEPYHDWSPDRLYERRWALTLLEQVLTRMALNCNWFICSDIGGHFPEIDDAVY